MKKSVKIFLIVCAVTFGIGFVLAMIGFAGNGLSPLLKQMGAGVYSSEDMVTKTIKADKFDSVKINSKAEDIEFVNSDEYKIECTYSKELGIQKVTSKNGQLTISSDEKTKSHFLSFDFGNNKAFPKVKIYCPMNRALKNVDINMKNGDLLAKRLNTKKLALTNEYGDANLLSATGNTMDIKIGDGDLNLKNVRANTLTVKDEYGDVNISGTKAASASIDMTDGDLDAKDIKTLKNLEASNQYGDMTFSGTIKGTTNIIGVDGDVSLDIDGSKNDYYGNVDIEDGDVEINGHKYDDGNLSIAIGENKSAKNKLNVKVEYGDIDLNFR